MDPNNTEQNDSQPSALERHIDFFKGNDGKVSYDSMKEKLLNLGESEEEAASTANAVSLLAGVKISGCPYHHFFAKDAVGTLNHPRDTGIFNMDGSINEARWQKLCDDYSVEHNGTPIITESKMREFVKWCQR